jgi:Na+/phosphate symporter
MASVDQTPDDPFAITSYQSKFSDSKLTRSQASRTIASQIEDTSKHLELVGDVGEKLLAQKQMLAEKLKVLESEPEDAEVSPELRQQLEDLQRNYDEVGRESSRAFSASTSKSAFLGAAYDTPSRDNVRPTFGFTV